METATTPTYEYRGLMATTWDLFRGDTSNWADRHFFRKVVREFGEPVLDIGCGTGRILLDYLRDGVAEIDGVDNSPEMLDLCRKKAQVLGLPPPNLYRQQMETLDLPRRYRTILVPSSSLQLVLEPEGARVAMARFYEHLLPGGVLTMPLMTLWQQGKPLETEWHLAREATRADGTTFRKFSHERFDPTTGLEHTEDRYEAVVNGEVVATENHRQFPATRSYTQDEALALF